MWCPLFVLSLALLGDSPARAATPPLGHPGENITTNDNRHPAGTRRGGVLRLRLDTRIGIWYPDGDDSPGAAIPAFAETGHPLQVPGPLVRVAAGTEVVVTVTNSLTRSVLTLHGLVSRPVAAGAIDSVHLAAGESREIRMRLDVPGTYYYWGSTMGRALEERTKEDAQLTGAIIVDPAGATPPPDRVMVIGMWADTAGHWFLVRKRMLVVMNGRSWPHTERLSYAVGDTVRWRVINASADAHPMHLHGFYFRVDSRGNGVSDSLYAEPRRDHVVTDLMKPGMTMTMTWSPDRPGNWLFHCHLPVHFAHRGSLGMPPAPMAASAHATMNHALQGMSGLVMGVTVRGSPVRTPTATSPRGVRRQVRLVIRANANGSAAAPNFEFALADGDALPPASAGDHGAPPLVLARGEPVDVTVVNTLTEATAVHWHGIELESYYDGVAGFSGTPQRLSPVIAPGDSFVARFTPPRAGTFIYHTHIDEERQQPAGLAGPIIVLTPGERYDASTDLTVVASSPRGAPVASGPLPRVALLNGSRTPEPFELVAGVRYRFRFINMTVGIPGMRFELTQEGSPVRWRPIAKDGADLPADRQVVGVARQSVSIGETADVAFVAERAGTYQLVARIGTGAVVATLPVHVSFTRAEPGAARSPHNY